MLDAVRTYVQVLGALLRREEESRRHAPMESILNLLEPIFLIATMSFLFYFLGKRQVSPLGGAPVLYYATGFFPLYFFIYVSRRMRGSISAPARRFPIERRLDHIIVHIILRIIDYAILGILLFGSLYLLFTSDAIPADVTNVWLACLALLGLGFGWGTLNLVVGRITRFWNIVSTLLARVLMLFSGVFFVPDFLPPATRDVLAYNPMLHAIQLFRLGFYPQYPALLLDRTYLFYSAALSLLFGLVIERVTRRLEVSGSRKSA
jgi:capsular polysaccharide transport system permease protein